MRNNMVRSVLLIVAVMLVQIVVLDNINVDGYITPYIYIIIILLVPYSYNMGLVLILSFLIGLTIDIFSGTGGLHAMACTLLGAVRGLGVSTFLGVPKKDIGSFSPLTSRNIKYAAIITLLFLLVFIHHAVLYVFESLSFSLLFNSLWHALLNTIVTVFVCILILMFMKSKQRGW
ncbi:MAG: hypothetical protein PHD21_03580 [Flavobacteriales bacterium]|nr:hypothetical protein [Flavobacteriales bacterium]